MLSSNANTFASIVGVVVVCGLAAVAIRGALRFWQGFEQGFGVRLKSDMQTIFSRDE